MHTLAIVALGVLGLAVWKPHDFGRVMRWIGKWIALPIAGLTALYVADQYGFFTSDAAAEKAQERAAWLAAPKDVQQEWAENCRNGCREPPPGYRLRCSEPPKVPDVGCVLDNYIYLGGNPKDKSNWKYWGKARP